MRAFSACRTLAGIAPEYSLSVARHLDKTRVLPSTCTARKRCNHTDMVCIAVIASQSSSLEGLRKITAPLSIRASMHAVALQVFRDYKHGCSLRPAVQSWLQIEQDAAVRTPDAHVHLAARIDNAQPPSP